MTDARKLGMGDVSITLIDPATGVSRDMTLKPSLHAIRYLSRKYGGLDPVIQKIRVLDFDSIVDVIAAGIQVMPGDPKRWQELENSVYQTGLSDSTGGLPSLCVRYITHLIHGGRPPPDQAQGPAANPPKAE